MLEVIDIHKSFGDFKAVTGANLKVGAGEIVAVIGPNGAGKTTLFNLITGQLKPDRGNVRFKGEDITRLPPYRICRKGIARSFQITNIFPRLTVFRNVQVAVLSQQRKSTVLFRPAQLFAVEETRAILKTVGLLGRAGDVAGSLSHGDRKTLELAVTLGNRPELIVLDEPTAGMSPEETGATIALIRQLAADRGLTILFCEHDMKMVFTVARSIMVMHQGQTLIQDAPAAVRENLKVQQAYLGSSRHA
ncbi:MAG: ABC transporter ATP-binding protein [Thermodesulfobacteriota bacterium]